MEDSKQEEDVKRVVTFVVERLNRPPGNGARRYAIPAFQLDKELKEAFPTVNYTEILTWMMQADRLCVINGWVTLGASPKEPPSTGNDDLDWYLGLGRFAQ